MNLRLDRQGRLVLILAAALAAGALPATASAHAFLIRSSPQPRSRLASSPRTLTMYFSEPFVRGSERVSIQRIGGGALALAAPRAGAGAVIRQPLPPRLRGVFVVSWRVLSDDGHISEGEFAFAVAAGASALPTLASGGGAGTPWSEIAADWSFFLGFALAFGGLASERFVWRRARAQIAPAPAGAGVVMAGIGSLWLLVVLAGAERGGGFDAGLSASAIGSAVGVRPGMLTLVVLAALAISAPLLRFQRTRALALVPLLAAAVATSLRGHSGTSNEWWAEAGDIVHLAGAALWAGALAHLVLAVARARDRADTLADGVRGYSRLALQTVLVVLASGIVIAIPEFRNLSAVVDSGYGWTLLTKAGLIGITLLLALGSRTCALGGNLQLRWPLLRRLTRIETATLVAVLVAVAVLVNSAPPRQLPAANAASALLGPTPVAGSTLRLAEFAGQLIVGLTAGGRELQFSVFPPGYQAPGRLQLNATASRPDGTSLDLYPRPCGSGCFSIRFPLQRGLTTITADTSSSEWRGGKVRFAIRWPFKPTVAILRRAASAMLAVHALTYRETLRIGYGRTLAPRTYATTGRRFMQTEALGAGARDVRQLASAAGLTELAFVVPEQAVAGSYIWYRIWIDRRYRIRRELIVGQAGRISRTFDYRTFTSTRNRRRQG